VSRGSICSLLRLYEQDANRELARLSVQKKGPSRRLSCAWRSNISVAQAVLALSATPKGFTASELAEHVRQLSRQNQAEYGARRAAYDLKKLRGKQIVERIGQTARYQPLPQGLRSMAALVILRDKAIKHYSPPYHPSGQAAGPRTPPPSMPTMSPSEQPRRVSSMSSEWPHEQRQQIFRTASLSA